MTALEIIAALGLPGCSRVDLRVPKKRLLENGAPTVADRRQINDDIEELWWEAVLKPTTIGVPAYRDATREYLEISVLKMTLRAEAGAGAGRVGELVHRAIPYPIVLLAEHPERVTVSLAHKRWSLGEAGKAVLDGDVIEAAMDGARSPDIEGAFLEALPVTRQPRATLYALYQGWLDTVLALQAARSTGTFALADTAERAAARREALRDCARLEAEMAGIRVAAGKEKQLPRQVALNLELERLRAAHAAARAKL